VDVGPVPSPPSPFSSGVPFFVRGGGSPSLYSVRRLSSLLCFCISFLTFQSSFKCHADKDPKHSYLSWIHSRMKVMLSPSLTPVAALISKHCSLLFPCRGHFITFLPTTYYLSVANNAAYCSDPTTPVFRSKTTRCRTSVFLCLGSLSACHLGV